MAFAHDRKPHAHYREAANFAVLENDDRPPARIRYQGPHEDRFIDRALWEPMVPYQPRWTPPNEGARMKDLARSAAMDAATRGAEAREATRRRIRQLTRR